MGFEDIFAGVQFDDAKINLTGPGQDEGKAGTPSPATDQGQKAESPAAAANLPADDKKADDNKGAEPDKEKPLPYDQDPKWKKARAAEAALQDIMKAFGFLDTEELKDAVAKGLDLQKLIGGKDPKALLEDADYLNKVRQNWDKEKTAKKFEGESPEDKAARLESELEKTRQEYENFKSGMQDREHAQAVLKNFKTEVTRVIEADENPLSQPERDLLQLYLGVDNPANMIDIEDKVAVRKMAAEGTAKFRSLIQAVRQSAIEQYVAGKEKLAVDKSGGSDAVKVTNQPERQKSIQPTNDQSNAFTGSKIDDLFDAANREFADVLQKGVQGLI